jgi:hypothetical protein
VRHACNLAKSFVHEGYEVVILDVVWADLGQLYRQELEDYHLRIVRLMPSWDEAHRRLHQRPHSITDEEAQWVYQQQVLLQDFDYDVDNTNLTAEDTARWLASLPKTDAKA